jgi:hypothetical protein
MMKKVVLNKKTFLITKKKADNDAGFFHACLKFVVTLQEVQAKQRPTCHA